MISNKKNILILISTFSMFSIFLGITFSFFSTRTIGNETAANINLTTSVEEVTFIDGPALNINNLSPGTPVEKTFRVESNSSEDFQYHIIFDTVQNGVSNIGDLTYTVSCVSYSNYDNKTVSGTCDGKNKTSVPNSRVTTDPVTHHYNIIKYGSNIIPANYTHEYTLTFEVDENISPTVITSFSASFKLVSGKGPFNMFRDGTTVYFNPTTNKKCDDYVETNSNTDNKTGCLKWYAFLDDGSDTVNLLLDHNTSSSVRWSSTYDDTGGDAVLFRLTSNVSSWHQDVKSTARIISAQEIANITEHSTFNKDSSSSYYFETLSNTCSVCSTLGKGNSKYAWLFDRTISCENYGCSNNSVGTETYGYWTINYYGINTELAWYVGYNGYVSTNFVYYKLYGVRPVVEIPRTKLFEEDETVAYFNPITNKKCDDYVVANSNTDNKTGCLKWYKFLDDGSDTINLLLDHNTTATTRWSSTIYNDTGADAVLARLTNDVSSWHSAVKSTARLISAQEVASITAHPTFNVNSTVATGYFYFETLTNVCSQCLTLGKGNAKYAWLFNRTSSSCEARGCLNNAVGTNTLGYWTSSKLAGNSYGAWFVDDYGRISSVGVSIGTDNGVRPVITIPKSKLQ